MDNKLVLNIILFILIFTAGFSVGYFTPDVSEKVLSSEQEERLGGYKYINPLLECDTPQEINREIKPFKTKLTDFIEHEKSTYGISQSAVYFRDLNNGPWIGINEKTDFSPASMLKVPLLISVLKLAESNPEILQKEIEIKDLSGEASQIIKPSEILEIGKSYSIDKLIYNMIVYSDNNANNEVFKFIGQEESDRVFNDFNLLPPILEKPENFMNVKEYASFFRILYNSSYLNKAMSEKALELLAKAEFREGLVAGVPGNITVSHKFGERIIEETGEKQLHDCGIIYYPNHPYLLCIMNRGQDYGQMQTFIKLISELAYSEVEKQF